MPELLTHSKFFTVEEANRFGAILESAGIPCKIEHEKNVLDKVYIGEDPDPLFAVKVSAGDFDKVNELLRTQEETELNDVDPDYYLFHFSNDELLNVVNNTNDWNHFDQALAKKILEDKHVRVPPPTHTIEDEFAYTPATLRNITLVGQYILSVIAPYVGLAIGLATIYAFKTLQNGIKVKIYDEPSRNHGKAMIGISLVRTLLPILYYFFVHL